MLPEDRAKRNNQRKCAERCQLDQTANLMKYAVCQFYPSGEVFPVEINIPTESRAAQLRSWMQQGPSATEDWRAAPMAQLRELLTAGKVRLECFTLEAQAEKRAAILNA